MSRSPCNAVSAAIGAAAASSKVTLAGFKARDFSLALTYSANPPLPPFAIPNTSSPTWNFWISLPTAITLPAISAPSVVFLGFSRPSHQADEEHISNQEMPVISIDRCCMNFYEDFIVEGVWSRHILELENIW
jgi:hypothetical protein